MSWAWTLALRSMTSRPSSQVLGRRPARSGGCSAQPRMALSGVRSSCERVARNSSFMRLAASASALAAWAASRSRSRSSRARFSAVMSRPIFEAPMISPVGVADGRDGERDVDDGAVLPRPVGLVVVHPLAAADRSRIRGMSSTSLGRHEHGDVLADDLLGGVAEDPLGPGVPARDDAVEVFRR